jgi:hypothetical protein
MMSSIRAWSCVVVGGSVEEEDVAATILYFFKNTKEKWSGVFELIYWLPPREYIIRIIQ